MNWDKELINQTKQKSKQAFEDATLLFENNRLAATMNRIYYSMFYNVSALLLTKNLSSSKHQGIISLFNKEFVLADKVDRKWGRFFRQIFAVRQQSDYGSFEDVIDTEVKEWFEKAREFNEAIDKLLEEELANMPDAKNEHEKD